MYATLMEPEVVVLMQHLSDIPRKASNAVALHLCMLSNLHVLSSADFSKFTFPKDLSGIP